MIPEVRVPAPPGDLIAVEGRTVEAVAEHLRVSAPDLAAVIRGERPVTAVLAWRLAQALRTTPQLWMNLQALRDLALARPADEVLPLVSPR